MAAVYAARHRIGRIEAVKILHRHLLENSELLVRFEREARVANRFKHPGAIQITDVDVSEDGCPFLVMELAEGVNLSEHVRHRRLNALEILGYADQVLDVLATAHPLGIVHRDIKPANLVLQSDGRLRVLDFGVAKIEGSTFTAQGATVGTASYMAPEQVRGEGIDGRADLFAVGATMFRLLSGRQLREGPNPGEILFRAAMNPVPRLFEVLPGAPVDFARVVDKALEFDADDRYQDARTMQNEVREAIHALTHQPAPFANPDTEIAGPSTVMMRDLQANVIPPVRQYPSGGTLHDSRSSSAVSGAVSIASHSSEDDDEEGNAYTIQSSRSVNPKKP